MIKRALMAVAALTIALSASPACAKNSYADDRALIENMSNHYMVAVDAGDIETVMKTWADDGVLDWVGGVEHGADAIRKAMSKFGGGAVMGTIPLGATERQRNQHQIVNHVIMVNGDTATSFAYWFALTNKTTHGQIEVLYMGHYEDELARINGEWKFKKRTVFNESRQNKSLFYPGLGEKDPRR
ncbi:MAG: nuclear transport factor 2 family protein [Croceibacterium sp.]